MIRHSLRHVAQAAASAAVLSLVVGCGQATTVGSATPTSGIVVPPSMPSVTASGPASAGPSGSAAASPSAGTSGGPASSASAGTSPSETPPDLGLPHADSKLEAVLPAEAGGIPLERFSLALDKYMASSTGGDKELFTPWLVQFGKTPAQVNAGVAADLSGQENLAVIAIQVPGATAAELSSQLAATAATKKWGVSTKAFGGRSVLELVDPSADTSNGKGIAYAYANDDTMFFIVTDDPSLLLEALAKLP